MSRKTSLWGKFCFLLAFLLLLSSCNGKNQDPVTTADTGEESLPVQETSWTLADFQLVRSDNASDDIIRAVTNLNQIFKTRLGTSLTIKTDLHDKDEAACEILIGMTERTQSKELLSELGEQEYVIQTVSTDAGMKIVIGGKEDAITQYAVERFIEMLNQNLVEGDDGKVNTLNLRGEADFVLTEDEVSQLAILVPSGSNTLVINAVRNLWKTVRTVGGSGVELVQLDADASIEDYPYALIIGEVGAEAKALTDGLPEKTHAVKTKRTENGYRAWMVGSSEYEILRAVQAFHTEAVVNGVLTIPGMMNLEVTSKMVRDPCIVVYEGKYYVYENAGSGYGVRVSDDLLTWSQTTMVFDRSDVPGFPGTGSFWAPEVHYYNGAFYLFGTYLDGNTNLRGTAIFRSETPAGKFVPWSDGFITPKDRHSIDGTLYIEDGVPYMVYVDEWPNYGDTLNHDPNTAKGRMAYVQLSEDLKQPVGEYHTDLFCASDPEWTDYGITDGPWMYRCEDGTLLMLWSNRDASGNYCVGIAKSSNGKLTGTWIQSEKPFFTADGSTVYSVTEGGHCMVFEALDGRMYLSIHTPNSGDNIAMTLIPIVESNGMLYIDTVK